MGTTKKALVVGLGIGNLYSSVLTELGYRVVTVDRDLAKSANFKDIPSAIAKHKHFAIAIICTPNFTHDSLARLAAPSSDIVLIEKPGVRTAADWKQLSDDFPETRFAMVKNNMWRDNIAEIKQQARDADNIHIEWIRLNCIPFPGSWFTDQKFAFGGVSRDLMPHLLSLYIALNDDWQHTRQIDVESMQFWTLDQIDSTDYGTINYDGVYDVDDFCRIRFEKWILTANWRSMTTENSAIDLITDDKVTKFELGWCSESAYKNMLTEALANVYNDVYWARQLRQDIWIHEQLEKL
jgi:predicted dehydrogenase